MTPRHGILIAFEGIDGCGKSTQAALLAERLRAEGRAVVHVREPGATPVAEAIREILLHGHDMHVSPEAEMFLYVAARADLYSRTILPALARGDTVISDRCFWSTIAYQGDGLGLGIDQARALSLLATRGREPDLVLLFDLPPAAARARSPGKEDRIEARGTDYLAQVRAAFLEMAARQPQAAAVLDGTGPIPELQREVMTCVRPLLERPS